MGDWGPDLHGKFHFFFKVFLVTLVEHSEQSQQKIATQKLVDSYLKLFFFILRDIAKNSNGHKSVNFYPNLKIQNSTNPCIHEVSEYVRYMVHVSSL